MKKVERAFGLIIFLAIAALVTSLTIASWQNWSARQGQPSGIWTGLVDDLPSGRVVECVFARDPSGAVALTCDWSTAVRVR